MKDDVPTSVPTFWATWRGAFFWAGLAGVAWLLAFRFPAFWVITGIGEPNRPFFDLYALLAARDAVRLGLDPYALSVFDPYHRPHLYTEWWLAFSNLGVGRADTPWVGTLILAGFLANAAAWIRPRTARDGLLFLLLLLSPAFFLAVHRVNNDLVVLGVVSIGLLCFRRPGGIWQGVGIVAFACAAVLKYYPLVTVILLLELRTWRRVLAGAALYAAVLLLAAPGLVAGLFNAARHTPVPEWLYAFGAPTLWRDVGVSGSTGWLLLSAVMVGWAGFSASSRIRGGLPGTPTDETSEREFICGAAMIVGVFFLGASYVYKLVFALWLVPWLRENSPDPGARGWRRATAGLLMTVLWLEGLVAVALNLWTAPDSTVALGILKATIITAQLLEWAVIALLLRFLLIYLVRRWRGLFRPAGA